MIKLILILCAIAFADIPRDKQLHYGAGMGIAYASYITLCAVRASKVKRAFIPLAMAAFAGIGKEVYDTRTHNGDSQDILVTMAGGVSVALVVIIF